MDHQNTNQREQRIQLMSGLEAGAAEHKSQNQTSGNTNNTAQMSLVSCIDHQGCRKPPLDPDYDVSTT